MSATIHHLTPGQVRGMMRRKQAMISVLHRTGIWRLLQAASAHGGRIEVTRHRVPAPLARPLTVALLADLHLASSTGLAERVLALVAAAYPDLILLAGDLTSIEGHDGI